MSSSGAGPSPVVVVTGANGFLGSHICAALVERGATVRAVVRRRGSSPSPPRTGVEEWVGDFYDPHLAAAVVKGANAVVSTVHPMGTDRQTQHRIAVEGTPVLARATREAGMARLVHISTAAVYDRRPGAADADESTPLVGDQAGDYAVTKRDTDLALAKVDGLTRVLLRPPAILGPGETSVWNSVRPAEIRAARKTDPIAAGQSFAWVHVDDLAAFATDVATVRVPSSTDPDRGPVEGACTAVNVVAGTTKARDYFQTVADAVGAEPVWGDRPAWTGRLLADRARGWGWTPTVDLAGALAELRDGLSPS